MFMLTKIEIYNRVKNETNKNLCLFVCPIITHEPLERFASILNGNSFIRTYLHIVSLIKINVLHKLGPIYRIWSIWEDWDISNLYLQEPIQVDLTLILVMLDGCAEPRGIPGIWSRKMRVQSLEIDHNIQYT